ncbi:hypothetical protein XENOCAPTIV_011351, partial [Xenoophorus captivus]
LWLLLIFSIQILRQFEALMGGSLHATRQDAAHSSHQATSNQFLPSAYLENSQATNSADYTTSELYQPEHSSSCSVQPQSLPSSPSSLEERWRCSTGEQMDDLTKNMAHSVRTAGDPGSSSLSSKPEKVLANHSSLSLFSGMELVTKGGPLCGRDAPHTESDQTDCSSNVTQTVLNFKCLKNSPVVWTEDRAEVPSGCSPASSDESQPASAFSFLNS